MTVRSAEMKDGTPTPTAGRINGNKVAAVVAQLLSLLTTYWAVEWVAQPQTQQAYGTTLLIAVGIEFLLVKIKGLLFDQNAGNDSIGWVGFAVDAIINAAGALPRAGRLITWPPVAAVLGVFSVNAADANTQQIGGFLVALVGGIILSVLPHRLWRAGSKR